MLRLFALASPELTSKKSAIPPFETVFISHSAVFVESNPRMYPAKIGAVVVVSNLLGVAVYQGGGKARPKAMGHKAE